MLLAPLFVLAACGGIAIAELVLRWPSVDPSSPRVARRTAESVEHVIVEPRDVRRFVSRRTNPEVATGLLLTVALVITFVGALVIGALAVLVRSDSGVVTIDHDISSWVNDHTTRLTHDVLQVITQFGATGLVVVAAVVVAIVESIRRPSRWIVPFLAVVLIGQSILTNGLKELLDRVRPALNPAAHLLGPSFPSGHTATAAAFWAAVALLMGRARGRRARAALAGAAAAIAIAVGCSRVLLDVHWFSDVIAGLALGWAWFAISSIAFGGRLLKFGAPVEAAERTAALVEPSVPVGPTELARTAVGVQQPRVQEMEEGTRED